MATPPRIKEESPPLLLKRESEGPYDIYNSRKRNCDSLDESLDDSMWELNDDGRPKTRRVNPHRLAVRLGPYLVAEMEALIVPGAKMPTFSVRKDFQERYQVDRRHIYDYFHSRGLRVAKEDKHTNLIRGRAMKAQAQAQLHDSHVDPKLEAITANVKQENPDIPLDHSISTPHHAPRPRGRTITKRKIKLQEKKPRIMRRATLPSSRVSKVMKTLPESIFLVAQSFSGDGLSESGPWTSSSGTDTDWEPTPNCPQFTLPNDSSDDTTESCGIGSDFLRSPDEFVVGYFDSPLQPEVEEPLLIEGITTCDGGLESFMSVDEHRLLTEEERTELYNLINNNIPCASGVEESAGTYNTYMSEKMRSYFDRLLPVSRHARTLRAGTHAHKPSTTATTIACNSPAAVEFPELRKWLSDDADLYQPVMNTYKLNPASDDLEANLGHDDVPNALVGACDLSSGSVRLDGIPFQQFHNRAALGIPLGTTEEVGKRVVKSSGEGLENINPVSSA